MMCNQHMLQWNWVGIVPLFRCLNLHIIFLCFNVFFKGQDICQCLFWKWNIIKCLISVIFFWLCSIFFIFVGKLFHVLVNFNVFFTMWMLGVGIVLGVFFAMWTLGMWIILSLILRFSYMRFSSISWKIGCFFNVELVIVTMLLPGFTLYGVTLSN